ncbi:hypothetical protein OH77DRAFT_1224109 [Trametes cingulata]|nr:hypothetical protein OH77DRAFT_1224109 [Trametes cingulata]
MLGLPLHHDGSCSVAPLKILAAARMLAEGLFVPRPATVLSECFRGGMPETRWCAVRPRPQACPYRSNDNPLRSLRRYMQYVSRCGRSLIFSIGECTRAWTLRAGRLNGLISPNASNACGRPLDEEHHQLCIVIKAAARHPHGELTLRSSIPRMRLAWQCGASHISSVTSVCGCGQADDDVGRTYEDDFNEVSAVKCSS